MGNSWRGISNEKQILAEIQLYKRAGLTFRDFGFADAEIKPYKNEKTLDRPGENYIHAVEIKRSDLVNEDLPIIIIIHGYGSGGAMYHRLVKKLAPYFHIFVLDLLGMGCSGRPEYNFKEPDEAEEFFVDSLRQWKVKVFKEKGISQTKKYYLCGHSLGGYISSVYALKYENELEKLILLSPVGIPKKPEDFDYLTIAKKFDTLPKRVGARMILYLWDKSFTPFDVLRYLGESGTHVFLKFYMSKRMPSISDLEEIQEVKNYFQQIFLRPSSSEQALNTILSPGSWARKPLQDRIVDIKAPIVLMYGDRDWMDSTIAKQLVNDKKINGTLHVIENSDHHLYLDNPIRVAYKILVETHGLKVAQQYLYKKQHYSSD